MPFSIRPFRRFPVHCSVTYNATPFQHAASGLFFVFWVKLMSGWSDLLLPLPS